MLHAAPLGRALPLPPISEAWVAQRAVDDDVGCALAHPTPRPSTAVKQLARRALTATMLAKYCAAWGAVSFALWMLGTALALVITKLVPAWGTTPIFVLGFGGLGGGLASGCISIHKRRTAARALAREGQLVTGVATYRRSLDTVGEMLASPLGEQRYCIRLSIGFIRYDVWVALSSPVTEGARHEVLVQPGARLALVFDGLGRGHVGDLHRI